MSLPFSSSSSSSSTTTTTTTLLLQGSLLSTVSEPQHNRTVAEAK
eukprot:gene2432-5372_t